MGSISNPPVGIYAEGQTVASGFGTALMYKDGSNNERQAGSANPFPITGNINATSTAGQSSLQTFNLTASGQTAAIAVTGYSNITLYISGTYGSFAGTFEVSLDGGVTYPILVQGIRTDVAVAENVTGTISNLTRGWNVSVAGATNFRFRCTALTSGTAVVNMIASSDDLAYSVAANMAFIAGTAITTGNGVSGTGVQRMTIASDSTYSPVIAAGTAAIGSVNLSPTAVGGWKKYLANAVKTVVTISGSAGKFAGTTLINTDSAPTYLQCFDTTGAVTLGTTVPDFAIPFPANGTAANGVADRLWNDVGASLANGLKAAATTTLTGASTSTNGLSGSIFYF